MRCSLVWKQPSATHILSDLEFPAPPKRTATRQAINNPAADSSKMVSLFPNPSRSLHLSPPLLSLSPSPERRDIPPASSPNHSQHPSQHPYPPTTTHPANPPSQSQVRYAATTIEQGKSARAHGSYLRVSFKNTRETAQAINGWKLQRALTYLDNVIEHKEAVPMRRYAGSTGRTAQGESIQ